MVGNLAVTDVSAVKPDIEAGIHALKIQECTGRFPAAVPFKMMQVSSAGILLGNIRRISSRADDGI